MLSDRPYRQAIGHDAAIAELRAEAGAQFDPELVDLFCRLYEGAPPRANAALITTTMVASPVEEDEAHTATHRARRPRAGRSA
jgi:HD-GYP domain-containing protein (c-di-GMP phosphodiesterase class II)